jgi:hypothetical protein
MRASLSLLLAAAASSSLAQPVNFTASVMYSGNQWSYVPNVLDDNAVARAVYTVSIRLLMIAFGHTYVSSSIAELTSPSLASFFSWLLQDYNQTGSGFGSLTVTSNTVFNDSMQAFAAGMVEGGITSWR